MTTPNDPHGTDALRDGAKQIARGAGQVASELKGRVARDVAPAARRAAETARDRVKAERDSAGGTMPLARRRSPQLLISAAALMLLGLVLPISEYGGDTVSYLTMPDSDGIVVIASLLALSALAAFRMTRSRTHAPLRIGTGALAIVVAVCGVSASLPNIGAHGLTPGILVIALGALSIGAMGIVTLTDKKDHVQQN